MDKYEIAMIGVTCFIVGLMVGLLLGRDMQMNSYNNLLKKMGIKIIETRVFNGEPEYSYKIVEQIKKEEEEKK